MDLRRRLQFVLWYLNAIKLYDMTQHKERDIKQESARLRILPRSLLCKFIEPETKKKCGVQTLISMLL